MAASKQEIAVNDSFETELIAILRGLQLLLVHKFVRNAWNVDHIDIWWDCVLICIQQVTWTYKYL